MSLPKLTQSNRRGTRGRMPGGVGGGTARCPYPDQDPVVCDIDGSVRNTLIGDFVVGAAVMLDDRCVGAWLRNTRRRDFGKSSPVVAPFVLLFVEEGL